MTVEREKGAVVASCPVHPDVDLEAQRQLDGAVAYSTCPECSLDREIADEQRAEAEGREVGSHVDGGDDPLDIPAVQPVVIDDPQDDADDGADDNEED